MPKDDLVYLGHILDQARKIEQKVQGKSRDCFDQDENLRLALAHLIQTIGEAARRLSEDFRKAHPQVPWRAIIGMRNKVVHDYMNVDDDVVWRTAMTEIPVLIESLRKILPPG